MAKIFKKLFIGDSVATSGTRAFKKLSTEEPLQTNPYLTFSSPNTFTLGIVDNAKYWDGTLEYSTDTTTWNTWDGTAAVNSGADGKLYMRGTGNTYITGSNATTAKGYWVITGSDVSCEGNIETLLDYVTAANGDHPTMAENCYNYMFYKCTALTTAPKLPATTLASSCYDNMFGQCESLSEAPELPAVTLAESCYSFMFSGCTSLKVAPELPAITLAKSCYYYMFSGCDSLKVAPELPATTLASGCYQNMFSHCVSLSEAPELPATTLASSCYDNMFYGCTSLTNVPELPATTLAGSCYRNMFYECAALTTAPKLPATTLADNCYESMFRGCTSLTNVPELPATTLTSGCYRDMFRDCTIINGIVDLKHAISTNVGSLGYTVPSNIPIWLGTSLTTLAPNTFAALDNTARTITLYYWFTEQDTPQFDTTNVVLVGTKKSALTYLLYTDNTVIKDAALAKADQYTTVNVYHLDGSAWEG